jgi:hypothetical protein
MTLVKLALTIAECGFLLKSTDTSGSSRLCVGTRIASPSSFPINWGSTNPTAVAAPAVVGIILTAADRARRIPGIHWSQWDKMSASHHPMIVRVPAWDILAYHSPRMASGLRFLATMHDQARAAKR